jgi:ribosomal protein S1
MKNNKYTFNEYEVSERETLEKIYEASLGSIPSGFRGKDLDNNSSVSVTIIGLSEGGKTAIGETFFGQSVVIDINKEERILSKLGYPAINIEVGQKLDVVVHKAFNGQSFTGSVSAGYEKALKNELRNAIKDQNCAFKVKVISVCNGGFMVDLSGIKCFLPGSLAAANRIMDFSQYVGKDINVMVEIYDQKRDIFVVSFKKYLKKVIDSEVQKLSFAIKYDGIVTGSSNSGVFVEWSDMFTGHIPFDDTNKEKLSEMKSGDIISYYIIDIKNPQRIVLSLSEPSGKLKVIQELKDDSMVNKIYKGEITKMKTFGAFVKLENGFIGLVEKENLVYDIEDYEVGATMSCRIANVDLSSHKIQLIEEEEA